MGVCFIKLLWFPHPRMIWDWWPSHWPMPFLVPRPLGLRTGGAAGRWSQWDGRSFYHVWTHLRGVPSKNKVGSQHGGDESKNHSNPTCYIRFLSIGGMNIQLPAALVFSCTLTCTHKAVETMWTGKSATLLSLPYCSRFPSNKVIP